MKKPIAVIIMAMLMLSSCGNSKDIEDVETISERFYETEQTTETMTEEVTITTEKATEPVTEPETQPLTTSRAKSESRKLEVPYYSQYAYPTGCELVSTSMLLAYYGINVTAGDLVSKNYVSTASVPVEKDGKLVGKHPNKAFIGTPSSSSSYGCYSGAILTGLKRVLEAEKKSYKAVDLNGMSLEDICTYYVDYGYPVLVWASISMVETFKDELNTWYIEDTGEKFTWTSNEHCMVLVGYDNDYYYFNDPLVGSSIAYGKEVSEKRYEEMERQAIVLVETVKKEGTS